MTGIGRTRATPAAGRLLEQVGEVAVGVAVRRDPLVDLEDVDPLPVELVLAEQLEHPPRRVAAADRERERAPVGDRLRRPPSAITSAPRAAAASASATTSSVTPGGPPYFFSSWPPNCLRIAESTLSAKSSSPREAKRE